MNYNKYDYDSYYVVKDDDFVIESPVLISPKTQNNSMLVKERNHGIQPTFLSFSLKEGG